VKADIKRWNERDYIFYGQVTKYLDKHLSVRKSGKNFCYHDIAFVADMHIIGWAFYGGSNELVRVGLYVDGILKKDVPAFEPRIELQAIQTPRHGHNGFRFVLSDYNLASHIEVKALNTDQSLFSWIRN